MHALIGGKNNSFAVTLLSSNIRILKEPPFAQEFCAKLYPLPELVSLPDNSWFKGRLFVHWAEGY